LLDLLMRIEAGTANCSGVGDSAVGRAEPNEEEIAMYAAAGICPAGQALYVDDIYANLDVRKVSGHDIGIYYDVDTGIGDFSFKAVGTFYDKYEQIPGGDALLLVEAQEAGIIPPSFPVRGFDDLLRMDGNQRNKYNFTMRWRKAAWGINVAANYLSSFYDSGMTIDDGSPHGIRYVIPSVTTWNASVDYRFDIRKADTRLRFGINNLTDKRAPLADGYFGYFADAHTDSGRSYYLDLRLSF